HDVSFKGRTGSLSVVAKAVADHIVGNPGNHLIFCPSMQYLAELECVLTNLLTGISFFVQTSAMDDEQRASFLSRFASGSDAVGLAVVGGIFAEGIDLPGDKLVGVTVIGVGLPRLSLERDILQAHFQGTKGEGFDYAYRFPGMQRVLQAVGRLIRTEQDQGAALLIDQRFSEKRYRDLFPAWWQI
ncbi:MAG: helicase C-terminal domain-containing protein, partial [Chthoniobacterales bacterium]